MVTCDELFLKKNTILCQDSHVSLANASVITATEGQSVSLKWS